MLRPSDVQIDASLSTLATESIMGPSNFAADLLLPPIPVGEKTTAEWFKFGTEETEDEYDTLIAPTGETNEASRVISKDTTVLTEHGLHDFISQDTIETQQPPIDSMEDSTRMIIAKLKLGLEARVKTALNDTAVFAHATPSVKWDASTGTITILKNIQAGVDAFETQAGIAPNVITIPPMVVRVMKNDPTIADIIKHWRPELLIAYGFVGEIEGMRVVIPGVSVNTAQPGLTASLGRIWRTDNVLLSYVNPTPAPRAFSIGYQLRRKLYKDWMAIMMKTYIATRRAWWIEARYWNAEKITCANAGYIIEDVLT